MGAASRDGMAGRSRRPGWAAAARCAASVMGGAVGGSSALRRRARPTRSRRERPTARSGTARARRAPEQVATNTLRAIPPRSLATAPACLRRAAVARCRNVSLRLPVRRQDSASQWWITPRSALVPWRRAIRATPASIVDGARCSWKTSLEDGMAVAPSFEPPVAASQQTGRRQPARVGRVSDPSSASGPVPSKGLGPDGDAGIRLQIVLYATSSPELVPWYVRRSSRMTIAPVASRSLGGRWSPGRR
jgi:hypothetical protein